MRLLTSCWAVACSCQVPSVHIVPYCCWPEESNTLKSCEVSNDWLTDWPLFLLYIVILWPSLTVDIRFQIKLFNLNSVAAGRPGCRPGDVKLLQFNVWYLDRGRSISPVTAGDTVLVFPWFSVIYPALITLITTLFSCQRNFEVFTIFGECPYLDISSLST